MDIENKNNIENTTIIPKEEVTVATIIPDTIKEIMNNYGITREQETIIRSRLENPYITYKKWAEIIGYNHNYLCRVMRKPNVKECYEVLERNIASDNRRILVGMATEYLLKVMEEGTAEEKLKTSLRLLGADLKQQVNVFGGGMKDINDWL